MFSEVPEERHQPPCIIKAEFDAVFLESVEIFYRIRIAHVSSPIICAMVFFIAFLSTTISIIP